MKIVRAALAALVVWIASFAAADHLTPAQLATIKQDINANFLAEWNAGQIDTIVSAYNASASPSFIAWKTAVEATAYRDSITWTEFTGRSAGERDMFSFLTGNGALSLNCSRQNVRQAIQDAFSGATGVNSRTALIALCKRPVTRYERLFVTGVGSDATPGQLVIEGVMTANDVLEAMGN